MNSKVNIKCMICKKRFPESLFNVHECSGAKSYDCNICEKTFAERNGLAYHKRTHTGEKPYECKICKKKFSQSSSLIYMPKVLHYIGIIKLLHTLKELKVKIQMFPFLRIVL